MVVVHKDICASLCLTSELSNCVPYIICRRPRKLDPFFCFLWFFSFFCCSNSIEHPQMHQHKTSCTHSNHTPPQPIVLLSSCCSLLFLLLSFLLVILFSSCCSLLFLLLSSCCSLLVVLLLLFSSWCSLQKLF